MVPSPFQPPKVPKTAATARPFPAPSGGRWSPFELAALGGAVAVGLGLRLWQVEAWSFTPAELLALEGGAGLRGTGLWLQPCAGSWARLLAALLAPGAGEGWWRLPTVFGSTMAVLLLALVGELFVARTTALLAAWFLAVHPGAVAAGQTLLPGAWAAVFTLLAAGALVVAHRQRELGWAVTAALAVAAAMALDLTVGFALAGYAAAIALGSRRSASPDAPPSAGRTLRRGHWLLAAASAALPSVLWGLGGGRLAPPSAWPDTVWYLQPWWLGLAAVGMLLGDLFRAARRRALCGAVLVVVLPAAIFGPNAGDASAVAIAVPIVCLFAAQGAFEVGSRLQAGLAPERPWARRGLAGLPTAALLTAGLVAVVLQATAFAGARPPFREAAQAVLRAAGSKRLLVRAAAAEPALRYYLGLGRDAAGIVSVEPVEVPAVGAWLDGPAAAAGGGQRAEFAVLLRGEWLAWQAARAAGSGASLPRVTAVLPVAADPEPNTLYVLRRS